MLRRLSDGRHGNFVGFFFFVFFLKTCKFRRILDFEFLTIIKFPTLSVIENIVAKPKLTKLEAGRHVHSAMFIQHGEETNFQPTPVESIYWAHAGIFLRIACTDKLKLHLFRYTNQHK